MSYQELVENLKDLFLPALEEEGAVLVDLSISRSKSGVFLKLLVDRKEGGITISECLRLNKRIGEILDTHEMIKEGYFLEVSSPGLDRPLMTREDFARCINRLVMIFLNEPLNGKIQIDGRIVKVEEAQIGVEAKGELIVIPLSIINKAKQVIL